jgi:hypothetical protein
VPDDWLLVDEMIQMRFSELPQLAIGQLRPIEDQLINAIDKAQKFFGVDLVNTTEKEHYDD